MLTTDKKPHKDRQRPTHRLEIMIDAVLVAGRSLLFPDLMHPFATSIGFYKISNVALPVEAKKRCSPQHPVWELLSNPYNPVSRCAMTLAHFRRLRDRFLRRHPHSLSPARIPLARHIYMFGEEGTGTQSTCRSGGLDAGNEVVPTGPIGGFEQAGNDVTRWGVDGVAGANGEGSEERGLISPMRGSKGWEKGGFGVGERHAAVWITLGRQPYGYVVLPMII